MSADNYYRICNHPTEAGKFAVVMGFASDDELARPTEKSIAFDTIAEAHKEAMKDPIIEYGIHIDQECLETIDSRNPLNN